MTNLHTLLKNRRFFTISDEIVRNVVQRHTQIMLSKCCDCHSVPLDYLLYDVKTSLSIFDPVMKVFAIILTEQVVPGVFKILEK